MNKINTLTYRVFKISVSYKFAFAVLLISVKTETQRNKVGQQRKIPFY